MMARFALCAAFLLGGLAFFVLGLHLMVMEPDWTLLGLICALMGFLVFSVSFGVFLKETR